MKIAVASFNPVKISAVEAAFAARFPKAKLEVSPVAVASGVSEQPMSDEETRQGARNRAQAARDAVPEAEYWVGLEGGLEPLDGNLLASAWMVIIGPDGREGEARTPTLPLPPGIQALVNQGLELGEANDRVFSTVNSKQGGGAFGLLTEGRMTRQGIYQQALELALIPLAHPLWSDSPT